MQYRTMAHSQKFRQCLSFFLFLAGLPDGKITACSSAGACWGLPGLLAITLPPFLIRVKVSGYKMYAK